jgi:hypothetical protein
MILSSTTDTLTLTTESTAELHITAVVTDRNTTTGVIGATEYILTKVTTVTTTTIVAAPASGYTRKVLLVVIHAKGGPNDLHLFYDADGTPFQLGSARLQPTEDYIYDRKTGLTLVTRASAPQRKVSLSENHAESTAIPTTKNITSPVGQSIRMPHSTRVATDKRVAVMNIGLHNTQAGTTGIALGTLLRTPNVGTFWGFTLAAVTLSATAATFAIVQQTDHETLGALGTGTTGASAYGLAINVCIARINVAGALAESYLWQVGVQSEVNASWVVLHRGNILDAFEDTEQ